MNKSLSWLASITCAILFGFPFQTMADCGVIQHAVVQKAIIQEILVPTPVAVPVAIAVPTYQYYGTGNASYSQADMDKMADMVAQKMATKYGLLPSQKQTPAARQAVPDQVRPAAGPPSAGGSALDQDQPQDQQPPTRQPAAAGSSASFDFARFTTLASNSCAACHSGASAKGGLQMFNAQRQLLDLPYTTRLKLWDYVHAGDMPKGQNPLGDDDTEMFHQWAIQARPSRQR